MWYVYGELWINPLDIARLVYVRRNILHSTDLLGITGPVNFSASNNSMSKAVGRTLYLSPHKGVSCEEIN